MFAKATRQRWKRLNYFWSLRRACGFEIITGGGWLPVTIGEGWGGALKTDWTKCMG
jgi:hypothetical protein